MQPLPKIIEALYETTISYDAVSVPRLLLLAQNLPDRPPTSFIAVAIREVYTWSQGVIVVLPTELGLKIASRSK